MNFRHSLVGLVAIAALATFSDCSNEYEPGTVQDEGMARPRCSQPPHRNEGYFADMDGGHKRAEDKS